MLTSFGRSMFRRRARGSAYVATAALVVTLIPALALTSADAAPTASTTPTPAVERLWEKTSVRLTPKLDGDRRRVHPTSYRAYTLNSTTLATVVEGVPSEDADRATPARIRIPAPNGELVAFDIVESPVMEPELAAKHPEIRTFAGDAVSSAASVRLDITPAGFHAFVRGAGAAWYVDPAYQGNDELYVSYLQSSLPAAERPFVERELDEETVEELSGRIGEGPGALVRQREYRFALLTDHTYATYFKPQGSPTEDQWNAAVLAEKVTLTNRMNEVYGDDLGVRLLLVNDSHKLNFNSVAEQTGANGPCGLDPCFPASGSGSATTCSSALLNRNRYVIGQLIGAANYDVGHIGLGLGGGGIAGLGVVGRDGKARGCTGLPTPDGDYYAIDYVAHEVGHQFSGNHTFNGTQGSCSGNDNSTTSVEPGSGSSVMAYAGICRQDNVQPHSDPYFSQRSQEEIGTYITSSQSAEDEVQSAAFTGFDGTDSFTLTYPPFGSNPGGTTPPFSRDTTYNFAAMEAAISAVVGGPVIVSPHFSETPGQPGDGGFTITYAGLPGVDVPIPTLNATGFTGFVNDIVQGGPALNGGWSTGTPGNHNPVVNAPDDKSIPLRTPFKLTGSATDSDAGDQADLLYLWEQNDPGSSGTSLVDNTKADGPLFRIFSKYANVPAGASPAALEYHSPGENLADGDPTRVFPDMEQVLADNTNAETGACPAPPPPPTSGGATNVPVPVIECYAEFLPTEDYVGATGNDEPSLNFRLTARDQGEPAGGTDFADVKLTLDTTAGPFLVTSQSTPTTWTAGSNQIITWDRNNTHKPTLAPNVRILFSRDGGQTFPTVLLASTPNDGSESITVPTTGTANGRIMIEAVDNYFFDVNDGVVTITDTTAPETTITSGPADRSYVLSSTATFGFASSEPESVFTCRLDGTAIPCSGSSVTLNNLAPGSHTFTVAATDPAGNTDATVARRTIGVPFDDRAMKIERGKWKRKTSGASYLGTFTQVKKVAGPALSFQVEGATEVAILVNKGRKFGKLDVLFNGEKIAMIRLRSYRATGPVIVPVASFASPTSGFLALLSHNKRKVRVDGVGVIGQ